MKAPFIVYEHGDLMLYPQLDVLAAALEPIDVLNGEYVCYDAEGTVVHLQVEWSGKSGFLLGGHEVVRAVPSHERREEELVNFRKNYFIAAGDSMAGIEQALLASLVEKAVSQFGYSR